MPRFCVLLLFLLLPWNAAAVGAPSFKIEKIADGVYAAIAAGATTSNAFFVVGDQYVVAGGAHLNKEAIDNLIAAVAAVTKKPIRYFILPHHHKGYTAVDFDFPPDSDVIMSWQTWQSLSGEPRKISFPVLFFNEGMTLKLGAHTLILTNMEKGHTNGDTLAYLPESGILFASDLLYFDGVGYLGSGHMQGWVLALEFMEQIGAAKIIPGYGPVGTNVDVAEFKKFFKDFLTEVLHHIEAGENLEKTLRTFSLPRHEKLAGYRQFFKVNVERAYADLKETLQK